MKYGIYTVILENFLTKNLSLLKEYPSILTFGWGNGYVLLPTNHPLHGIPYDDIHGIRVHGGLTYGRFFNSESFSEWIEGLEIDGDLTRDNYKNLDGYWMIGFDTNHYGDDIETCSKEYVKLQAEKLMHQCLDDKIEGVKKYKYKYSRKEKLENINHITKK